MGWISTLKRYRFFMFFFIVNVILLLAKPNIGQVSIKVTIGNIKEMLMVIPPIFVLLGLLDVWVEKETMMKLMGEDSGLRGAFIAFFMGSAAAGPLYAAFPVAGIFLKKGVRLFNVFLFVGAWSTTKIPLLLFEASSLGLPYMLLRLGCNIVGIFFIAFIMDKTTKKEVRDKIYKISEGL